MINLDNEKSKRTHWVSLYIDRNTAVYFDSFGIEYILQEVFLSYLFHKIYACRNNFIRLC